MTNTFTQLVESVLADHATSYWFRDALTQALKRDPVDALADAEALTQLLHRRLNTLVQASPTDAIANEQALVKVISDQASAPRSPSPAPL